MMITSLIAVAVLLLEPEAFDPQKEVNRHGVTWNTPSRDASGSQPLGNGRFGANVWVEEDQDVMLLLSHTDAWSEVNRLIKLGRVRVHLEPNPFRKGNGFSQSIDIAENRIRVRAEDATGPVELTIAFDPTVDLLTIAGSGSARAVTATYETWRGQEHVLSDRRELQSAWTMLDAPASIRVFESADLPIEHPDAVIWRHRNDHSVVPFTLSHQGLDPIKSSFVDPLIHRTSGVRMTSPELVRQDSRTLASASPIERFSLHVAASCAQTPDDASWLATLPEAPASAGEGAIRGMWRDSYVFVDGEPQGAPMPGNSHPLRIGTDSNVENRLNADIKRIAIWNRALPDEGMKTLHEIAGGLRDKPEEMIAAWRGGMARQGIVPDSGGRGFHVKSEGKRMEDATNDWVTLGDSYLECPDDEALDLSSSRTFDVILRARSNGRILDKMTAGGSDGFIFDIHAGKARLITGNITIVADAPVPMNQWTHLAAIIDLKGGRRALYMNGKLVAQNGEAGSSPSRLTTAYVLQRLITASAAKGAFPIKFNGSIFTVEPRFTGGEPFNPDWRRWGGDYWWQNTRLSYEPMLARGEWNLMDSLFGLYERNMEGCKARAKLYYDAEGVYFPETMTGFGTYANNDYGWNREGLKASDVQCMYWRWAWQQNLEITDLMLQRYAYSLDEKFLVDRALPMARETLKFYQSRFARDDKGRLLITPTQAAETYWFDVINDTPTVAGLHAVLDQLLALPRQVVSARDRDAWTTLRASLPAIPVRERGGTTVLEPAEQYRDRRDNCEQPELYAVYPFRTFGLGHPRTLEIARSSYRQRKDPNTVGWTQDGQVAAMLGLTNEAAQNLLAKVLNTNPAFRYPIMWGPNFDWLPDQCHGGNLTAVLQKMLLQCWNGKIHVLPAWPRDWNVRFRLHAEGNTVVECHYREGAIVSLEVTPPSRKADLVLTR